MKGELYIYYDEEGDFLEINTRKYTEGHFKNLGKGVFERVDKKTGKVTGIAIAGFKKRTEQLEDIKIPLPVKLEIIS